MSSDYDEGDQAYDDLLRENDALLAGLDTARLENEHLRERIQNIAALIHYQEHLKHQDKWLQDIIKEELYTPDEVNE